MKVKSYRKYFGFVAALLIFSSVLPALPNPAFAIQDVTTRIGGTNTGVYIPLYGLSMFPGALAAKQAFPNVPFQININPASGPGSGPSTTWSNTVTQLQAAGAVVTGYVATGYGNDAISTVENEILEYHQWYPTLDGIMFDEVSGSCSQFSYYQTISNYVRSLGFTFIRANPGSSICQSDVPLFNEIAIVESGGYPSESTLSSSTFYPQYTKDVVGFGATLHGISSYDPTWLQMASKYVKWVYITDQQEPNPYTALPPYFNQYVSDLSAMATSSPVTGPTATVPSAPTGLTATDPASAQVNLAWTAPSSNGGAPITGYQIQRSTDGGTTWSTVQSNTGSTGTTFSDAGVAASNTYTYQVSAINSVGTSAPSNTASATIPGSTGSTGGTTPTSGTPLGIVFPLYVYPGSEWTHIIQQKQAHPSVPTIAIINPSNGPGSGPDSNVLSGVQQMQAAGIKVLGYVYTSYGGRSTSSAEADINSYISWYHVDGIFFDEMANSGGSESYYSALTSYVKSHGMTYTMGNPGTSTISSYVGTVDNLMIYESSGLPSVSTIISNTMGSPRSGFSFIAYGVGLPSQSYLASMAPYVSYVYITDAGGSNPYNALPSYYDSIVSELSAIDGTGTTSSAPGSPTALTAAASSSQVNLSWAAPSSNGGSAITGYNVYRGTASGAESATPIATGITTTTYADTGVTSGSTYYYTVTASNSAGPSPQSNEASATIGSAPIPPSPTQYAISVSSVDLSGKPITGMWTVLSYANGTAITHGFTPVSFQVASGTYTVSVANYQSNIFNHWNNGSTSNSTTVTPTQNTALTAFYSTSVPTPVATAPGSPTGLAAAPVSSSQINLSWTAPASNGGSAITGYKIERSTNNGTVWSTIASNTASINTTYSDTGLGASTTYTYRVSAINAAGTSTPSSTASATSKPAVPSAPSGLIATDPAASHVNLSWAAPSSNGGSAITGYNVYRGAAPGSESATPIATGVAATIYNDTAVTSGSTYYYTVTASNSAGTSPKSNEASVLVGQAPAPTPTQYAISVSSVDLSGKPITGMWTVLSYANGTAITHGFTPVSFQVASGSSYIVHVANYQSNIFNHWNNGSTSSSTTVTPTQNTALTAFYSTSVSTPVTITVNSAYIGGAAFTGQWVTLHAANGTIIASGYTPITFNGISGTSYTVHASNYQSTIFNHWSDGTTSASLAITPAQNTVLTAYFTNGMITINNVKTASGSTASAGALVLSGFSSATSPNSLLLVGVSANNAGVSSVTYGGIPLTRAVNSFYNNDAEFWYLANPSGSGNIVVTMSGATSAVIGAYSISGVNQTAPIDATASNHNIASSSPSVSITTVNPNDLVVDLPSIYGGVTLGTPTCAQEWDTNMPGAITGASSSATVQSAGAKICGWTASGTGDLWDDVALELKAAH